MDEVTIKPELSSSPTSSSGKLDVVDKWRARILLEEIQQQQQQQQSEQDLDSSIESIPEQPCKTVNWAKKIERQMAVLRVAFPFLTEQQLRGKAWQACGLNSVMGGLPRSGLSPKIKKEFTKSNQGRPKMPRKPRTKKEPVKTGDCPYKFSSPQFQRSDVNQMVPNSQAQTPVNNLLNLTATQLSSGSSLPVDSNTPVSKSKPLKRVHFDLRPDLIDENNKNSTVQKTFDASEPQSQFNKLQKVLVPEISNSNTPDSLMVECSDYASTIPVSNETFLNEQSCKSQDDPLYIQNANTFSSHSVIKNAESTDTQDSLRATKGDSEIMINPTVTNDVEKYILPSYHEDTYTVENPFNQIPFQKEQMAQRVNIELNMTKNIANEDQIGVINEEDCYPGETTPVQSQKIDARKKIIFETKAEVYRSDSDVIEENKTLEKSLENQNSVDQCVSNDVLFFDTENSKENSVNLLDYREKFNTEHFKKADTKEYNEIDQISDFIEHSFVQEKDVKNSNLKVQYTLEQTEEAMDCSDNLILDEKKLSDSELIKYGLVNKNTMQSTATYSPNSLFLTLPLTPADFEFYLPPTSLLSNYCSEHDKAYVKKDLRPDYNKNYYSKINHSLKADFEKIIPPNQSLKNFFEASDTSFKQVKKKVSKKVTDIIFSLDEDLEKKLLN